MVVGELPEAVGTLVVGGGPGGYVAAHRCAQLGDDVTLVERRGAAGLGGSCLHVGCIPSKALIELAEGVERTQDLAVAGLVCERPEVDLRRFQGWRGELTKGLASDVEGLLGRAGVRVIEGDARFDRPNRVAVSRGDGPPRFIEFERAILATGSRPTTLPAMPRDGERILDSTDALALEAVPADVAVIGAGYIGIELGTALAKLGARVTIVEALDRILPGLDAALIRPVAARLEQLGVELLLGRQALGVDEHDLIVRDADGNESRVRAERVIVAVGRVPNTDGLGLEIAGLELDRGGLVTVDRQRLANDRIAAIGDIVAGPALAHRASAEGIVAAEALAGLPTEFDSLAIPLVVFSDPEIASCGMTEEAAKVAGLEVRCSTFPLAASGRAATLGRRDGFARLVVERGSDRIVGVHLVGVHASELIAEGALAVEMAASAYDLATTIHPHPTLSESLADAGRLLRPSGTVAAQ